MLPGLKERLLGLINDPAYTPLKKEELALIFDIHPTEMPMFYNFLEELEEDGYIGKTKKGKIAAELGAFAVFMVFVYGFSRFGVMLPLQEADRAEAVYAATEKELRTLEKSNEVYGEVLAEYAHYGNGYLNEEESKLPDRRMMLDSLKSQIFPLTAVSSVSITSDQMSLEGTIPNGTLFPQLVRDAEADPNARYVTASLEETVKKDGEERVLASLKQVGVSMAVFFNEPEEGKEE